MSKDPDYYYNGTYTGAILKIVTIVSIVKSGTLVIIIMVPKTAMPCNPRTLLSRFTLMRST